MISKEQYEFSKVWFEEIEWNDTKIPKAYLMDEEEHITYIYLNEEETKSFYKKYFNENPQMLKKLRKDLIDKYKLV
jgi:hypothetical protein